MTSALAEARREAYRLALLLFAMASRHADEDLELARAEVDAALGRLRVEVDTPLRRLGDAQ